MNIVAIIAAFNEGDVIYHVIGDLIKNGLKVYFIDNCSTDNTVSEAGKWLGKGLIKIERFPDDSGYSEINKSKYVWKEILKRKEEIAQELNADWYIHTDADEFRESPFPGTTLSEGIKIIDAIGFNAINFQVLNFRPIDNSFFSGKDVRDYLRGFEEGEWFDEHQVKAWKNTGVRVNLSESGGHKCDFPNRKVCPLNFILRHYPIRSQIQGEIKLYTERFPRFTKEERNNGWHVQYDDFINRKKSFLYNKEALKDYNRNNRCGKILSSFLSNNDYNYTTVKLKNYIIENYPIFNKNEYSRINFPIGNIDKILEHYKLNYHNKKISNVNIIYLAQKFNNAKIDITKNKPLVSILIPVSNNFESTCKCLHSILDSIDYPNFEIIIVDNGSTDEPPKLLNEIKGKRITILNNNENIDFIFKYNLSAKIERSEYLMFLRNGAVVYPGWLSCLVQFIMETEFCGAVGSKLFFEDGILKEGGGCIFSDLNAINYGRFLNGNDKKFNFIREVDYCPTAALLIRKSLWNSIQNSEIQYSPAYWEDYDLCFDIRKLGYKVYYHPDSVIIHNKSKTADTYNLSGDKIYPENVINKFSENLTAELNKLTINNSNINDIDKIKNNQNDISWDFLTINILSLFENIYSDVINNHNKIELPKITNKLITLINSMLSETINYAHEHCVKKFQLKSLYDIDLINKELKIEVFNNQIQFVNFFNSNQDIFEERFNYELGLLLSDEVFTYHGYCISCKNEVDFIVDYMFASKKNGKNIPCWRERVICPKCNMNNRMRAFVHYVEEIASPSKTSKIYITEQTSSFYHYFAENYTDTIGSEYLQKKVPLGTKDFNGIRNEDVTNLSFEDSTFDLILSSEVFEYVSDFNKAFKELYRVLKPNGKLIFTVPFAKHSSSHIIRSEIRGGMLFHILSPEYHFDPNNPEGCLCFQYFGWEMFDNLKSAKFSNISMNQLYSKYYGYLGDDDIIFAAEK